MTLFTHNFFFLYIITGYIQKMNAIQQLFAPLDKDYCLLFYWLTVVNFIFLAVAGLGFISSLVLLFRGENHDNEWRIFVLDDSGIRPHVLPEPSLLLHVRHWQYEDGCLRSWRAFRFSSRSRKGRIGCRTRRIQHVMT
jgi:hypothetical protein